LILSILYRNLRQGSMDDRLAVDNMAIMAQNRQSGPLMQVEHTKQKQRVNDNGITTDRYYSNQSK
jgi:hypothetical protein